MVKFTRTIVDTDYFVIPGTYPWILHSLLRLFSQEIESVEHQS